METNSLTNFDLDRFTENQIDEFDSLFAGMINRINFRLDNGDTLRSITSAMQVEYGETFSNVTGRKLKRSDIVVARAMYLETFPSAFSRLMLKRWSLIFSDRFYSALLKVSNGIPNWNASTCESLSIYFARFLHSFTIHDGDGIPVTLDPYIQETEVQTAIAVRHPTVNELSIATVGGVMFDWAKNNPTRLDLIVQTVVPEHAMMMKGFLNQLEEATRRVELISGIRTRQDNESLSERVERCFNDMLSYVAWLIEYNPIDREYS